jgi:hypothetical protein
MADAPSAAGDMRLLMEYRLLIPRYLNDRKPVPRNLRKKIEDLICHRCRGFTAYRRLDGAWLDASNQRIDDLNDEYRLAVSEPEVVFELAREIGAWLGQAAMYCGLPDNRAIIIPVPGKSDC